VGINCQIKSRFSTQRTLQTTTRPIPIGLTSKKILPMANEMRTPSPILAAGVKGVIIIPAGPHTRQTNKNRLKTNRVTIIKMSDPPHTLQRQPDKQEAHALQHCRLQ
jgi:hypothetical protein